MTTSLSTGETYKNFINFFLIQSNQVCLIMFENSSALNLRKSCRRLEFTPVSFEVVSSLCAFTMSLYIMN